MVRAQLTKLTTHIPWFSAGERVFTTARFQLKRNSCVWMALGFKHSSASVNAAILRGLSGDYYFASISPDEINLTKLDQGTSTIGRNRNCKITIPDTHRFNPVVSNHHLEVDLSAEGISIKEPKETSYGTMLFPKEPPCAKALFEALAIETADTIVQGTPFVSPPPEIEYTTQSKKGGAERAYSRGC
ncbi:MAG: FHA domain-containing protein [bacterium]|nr:hypothetical protein [Candidatus Margulisiibacteriota bacterium]